MRALRYHAPGDLRLEDVPEPSPGAGEVKIRVRACSICGTDLKIYRHGHRDVEPPRVLGHEIAGEIVELGGGLTDPAASGTASGGTAGSAPDGVTGTARWAIGDRVQVVPAIPCGRCAQCRAGRHTVCPDRETIGYRYDGAFAAHMIVPARALAAEGLNRIPSGLGFAEASLAEPLGCVLNGQELARVGEGDDVVVVGAGPAGCLHVRLARARGAARVFLVEVNAERLERAAALVRPDAAVLAGDAPVADRIMKLTEGRGADVVIVAAASAPAQQEAVRYAARRGRISLFGSLPQAAPTATIDANLVHYRELTIVGAGGAAPAHNAAALGLIASGAVPVADLITRRMPLDAVFEALEEAERGRLVKVTIEP